MTTQPPARTPTLRTRQAGTLDKIRVDGPYGSPSIEVYDYDALALVCGGVGVTPMMSTVRWINSELKQYASVTKKKIS